MPHPGFGVAPRPAGVASNLRPEAIAVDVQAPVRGIALTQPASEDATNRWGTESSHQSKTLALRDAFFSARTLALDTDEDEDAPPQPEDLMDRRQKLELAEKEMIAGACSTRNVDGSYTWKSLKTGLTELGAYGVGVQLYFEYLWGLGLLFTFLFLCSIPQIYFYVSGTMLDDNIETKGASRIMKILTSFTVGNLGTCPKDTCINLDDVRNRKVLPGSDQLLKDVTTTLGILDLVTVVIFLLFVYWFRWHYIPKIVRVQDEAHVTAVDFAIEVSNLPRQLQGEEQHHRYGELLQKHFVEVLKQCGVKEEEAKIVEVALVREYDGCIVKFKRQGDCLEALLEVKAQIRLAKAAQKRDEKKIEKLRRKKDWLMKTILWLEESMKEQGDMVDEDREVCGAFIMFDREDHKQLVIDRYAASSNSYFARLLQDKKLRFCNRQLLVVQACEPTDLFWENMDYNIWLRKLRKMFTLAVSFFLLFFCVFVLHYLRATFQPAETSVKDHDLWVFALGPDGSDAPRPCMELCELRLFSDPGCENEIVPSSLPAAASGTATISSVEFSTATDMGQHDFKQSSTQHSLWDGDSKKQCSNPWRSAYCYGQQQAWGPENLAWISVSLTKKAAVKCVQIQPFASREGHPKPLEIHGCQVNDVILNSTGRTIHDEAGNPWELQSHCTSYKKIGMTAFDDKKRLRLSDDCENKVTLKAAELALNAGETVAESPRLRCFCLQAVAADQTRRIPGRHKDRSQQICQQWIHDDNGKEAFKYSGVLLVCILNQVLLAVFAYLDTLGRYRTATDLANSQMFNLFVAELVNTAVVFCAVGINLHDIGEDSFLATFKFGKGPFDDLSMQWFVTIGSNLFVVIAIQAVCTFALPVIWVLTVDPVLRWFRTRGISSQKLLDQAYELPDWTLSLRVAENLVIVFCVLAYSSGFPLLYPMGALYCFFSYWADKYTLLRGSRKPPQYTKKLLETACYLMPVAVLAHLAFSLWLFGQQELFPSEWGSMVTFVEWWFGSTAEHYDDVVDLFQQSGKNVRSDYFTSYLAARMLDFGRAANEPALVLFIIMVIYYAVVLVFLIFRPCLGLLESRISRRFTSLLQALGIQVQAQDTTETLTEAKERVKREESCGRRHPKQQLLSYQLWENDRYQDVVEGLRFNPSAEVLGKMEADKATCPSTFRDIGISDVANAVSHGLFRLEDALEASIANVTNRFEEQAEVVVENAVEIVENVEARVQAAAEGALENAVHLVENVEARVMAGAEGMVENVRARLDAVTKVMESEVRTPREDQRPPEMRSIV